MFENHIKKTNILKLETDWRIQSSWTPPWEHETKVTTCRPTTYTVVRQRCCIFSAIPIWHTL